MNTPTVPTIINLPAELHRKLCRLAEITNRPPEWLVLDFAESNVSQAFDARNLDCIVPCIAYDSAEEAATVAKAATAFENRRGTKFAYSVNPEPSEDGKFFVDTASFRAHRESEQRTNIISFETPDDARVAS